MKNLFIWILNIHWLKFQSLLHSQTRQPRIAHSSFDWERAQQKVRASNASIEFFLLLICGHCLFWTFWYTTSTAFFVSLSFFRRLLVHFYTTLFIKTNFIVSIKRGGKIIYYHLYIFSLIPCGWSCFTKCCLALVNLTCTYS